MSKIPILVMGFNRPDYVRRALESVKDYQPERLYLACDGPRADKEGEIPLVIETQNAMMDVVKWPCKVKTLFREGNLGCTRAVYEAITWFFEQEEYGIIIEDDVIVGRDFFIMCEELLPRYHYNPKVQQIDAFNPTALEVISNNYTFTKRPMIWGWATWKSKWESNMDMEVEKWQFFDKIQLIKIYGLLQGIYMWWAWSNAFKHLGPGVSWDTRWHFAAIVNDMISVCPHVNLSVNIGCTSDGAHYHGGDIDMYSHLQIGRLRFPLCHPIEIALNQNQHRLDNREFMRGRIISIRMKLKRWIKRLF